MRTGKLNQTNKQTNKARDLNRNDVPREQLMVTHTERQTQRQKVMQTDTESIAKGNTAR